MVWFVRFQGWWNVTGERSGSLVVLDLWESGSSDHCKRQRNMSMCFRDGDLQN